MRHTESRGRSSLIVRALSRVLALVVAACVVLLMVLVTGTAAGKWRFAPVVTGSMAPTIPQGSLVLAEPVPAADLQSGDVLLFNAPIPGKPLVMHRIYDRRDDPDGAIFQTKGDANDDPDAWTIRVQSTTAWRVAHSVPHVGKAIGLVSRATPRMIVLVGGVLLLLFVALRVVWSGRAGQERADQDSEDDDYVLGEPYPSSCDRPRRTSRRELIERRARGRRTTRRALVVLTSGTLLIGMLGATGLANALFTDSPVAPAPVVSSGQLPAPTNLTCRWPNATTLTTNWSAVSSGGFATGYHVQRSNTSGSGYSTIGTVNPESAVTFTDLSPGPPTLRYYVVTSYRGTWDSAASNQVVSGQCIAAINLVAGTSAGFSGDTGQATIAQLNTPRGVAVDSSDNVYIADTTNNRIRKVTAATGVISTIAGTGAATSTGDGGQATLATVNAPRGVAVDASNNVYIADTGGHVIRKITVSTGVITKIAGTTNTSGSTGDGAAATSARLNSPRGVALDSSNNFYIADSSNNKIRTVTVATGIITTFAGGGANTACTYSGAATTVSMSLPSGVAVDSSGTVYIADTTRNCIRKVVGTTVSQVAGGGATGTCGTVAVGSVSLSAPAGVGVDSTGRVVIADSSRNCLRMVSGANVVQVAGTTGSAGSTGDNGPAIAALLSGPAAVGANASGDIWIADTSNHRVRRVEGPL